MGVRLRLEGHGTHHASLAAISAYPFHEVAIDPRFIVDLPSEDIGERIARDFQLASAALDAVASVAGTATSTHALLLTLGETTQVRAFWCGPALKEEAWSDLLASKDGERSESDRVTSAASPSVPHSSNEMAPAAPTLQPVASIAETS